MAFIPNIPSSLGAMSEFDKAMTVAAEPRIAYHARRPHEICGFEILLTVRGSEFLALHGGIRRIAAGRPRMLRRSKSVEGSAITTL